MSAIDSHVLRHSTPDQSLHPSPQERQIVVHLRIRFQVLLQRRFRQEERPKAAGTHPGIHGWERIGAGLRGTFRNAIPRCVDNYTISFAFVQHYSAATVTAQSR